MKKFLKIGLLILTLKGSCHLHGQKNEKEKAFGQLNARGEVYFCMPAKEVKVTRELSLAISIDRISDTCIFAYANKPGFIKFLKMKIPFSVLVPPSLKTNIPTGKKNLKTNTWDFYPTYQEYLSMMQEYADSFPAICNLVELGSSIKGKKILAVKISDHVDKDEAEPEFFFTSTMHGDELTGYTLMLRLIDYLLNQYSQDNLVTELADNLEIWINPLANPDGTYYLSDTSVFGARRYNSNSLDLNRGFPEPGFPVTNYPTENQVMMDFMENHHFSLSANLHGGEEVVNYPWDFTSFLHADDAWYIHISRQYADTVHQFADSCYFTSLDNGITNGFAWYPVYGSRQDYVNYYLHGREVTIELSKNKIPLPSELPLYWEYNYRSLLNYMQQATFGIHGRVKDSVDNKPLLAKIEIIGHDTINSHVYSDSVHGFFTRYLAEGVYNLRVTSPGYREKQIQDVSIYQNEKLDMEIFLSATPPYLDTLEYNDKIWLESNFVPEEIPLIIVSSKEQEYFYSLFDMNGKLWLKNTIHVTKGKNTKNINIHHLPNNVYILKIVGNNRLINSRVIIMR